MKRIVCLVVALGLCLGLTSCFITEKTYTVALITGKAGITDRSSSNGAYKGISAYCNEKGVTFKHYTPVDDTTEEYLKQVEKAVSKGAKLVVISGFYLKEAAEKAIKTYEDVDFLLVDCYADVKGENVHRIVFREEQAGFLAGYGAVIDGNTSLGFIGGIDNEINQKYFTGFIQGAEYAAVELGIAEILVNYWITESLAASEGIKKMANDWYGDGIKVIMVSGEGIQTSVTSAANNMKGKAIGFDLDQGGYSERYLTSATKALDTVCYNTLESYFKNNGWDYAKAGKTLTYGIETDSIGLPTNKGSFRFTKWTVDEYETLYARMKSGKISVYPPASAPQPIACKITYFENGIPEEESSAEESGSQENSAADFSEVDISG